MKTTFKSLAILMMAAAGFAACSDDDNTGNAALKEYALDVKFNLIPNDSTAETQLRKAIESAMSSVGVSKEESYLYITARDSADAAPKVKEIGQKLEVELDKSTSQMHGDLYIMAIEKQQLESSDSKQRSWSRWYQTNYPSAENSLADILWSTDDQVILDLALYHVSKWYGLYFDFSLSFYQIDNWMCWKHPETTDLNDGAGGSFQFLKLYATANEHANRSVFWGKYIGDVMMLNTGDDPHYPEYVDIEKPGYIARYYPVFTEDGEDGTSNHDLNDKAGGPYLWMYFTRDKSWNDLILGNRTNSKDKEVLKTQVTKNANLQERNDAYYMHAFKKNAAGKWEDYGIANMNEGTKGNPVYFYMTFCMLPQELVW